MKKINLSKYKDYDSKMRALKRYYLKHSSRYELEETWDVLYNSVISDMEFYLSIVDVMLIDDDNTDRVMILNAVRRYKL